MKQLRFVILIMLIMLLLCTARAVGTDRTARAGRTNAKTSCTAGGFPICIGAQNRSSTTFSGGTSSSAGLCMNIFMYLNEEA